MQDSGKDTILVTGGNGAIGTWVIRALVERKIHPLIYDLFPPGKYLADIIDKITYIEGNISDLEKLISSMKNYKPRSVLHLAKYAPQDEPLVALKSNVLGSANVLEAARVNGIKRVVFTSSKSVLGDVKAQGDQIEVISEDFPRFDRADQRYIPFYTVTNKMVEDFGIRFSMTYDMEFVITRMGSTYGPGKLDSRRRKSLGGYTIIDDKDVKRRGGHFACLILDCAIEGKPFSWPEGWDHKDNLVYFKDLANGLVLAALSENIKFSANHREFLLDAGKVVTYGDLIKALEKQLPQVEIQIGSGRLTGEKHPSPLAFFDLTRSREELGYSPQYDVEAAVADYIEMRRKYDLSSEKND